MLLPMAPTDSLFLLGESREHPMHVGGLALFTPPEGVDAAEIGALFETAVASDEVAPLLRKRARRSVTTLGQWGWDTAPDVDVDVDVDYHVHRNALPQPGGMAELLTLVSRLHGTMLDRSRPLCEMHLIEGLADGRYAVFTKIHHALADGASAMNLLRRSLSEDRERRNMPAPWQPATTTPATDRASPPAVTLPNLSGMPDLRSLKGQVLRSARGVAGELGGLVPALADTADRALHARGGPLSMRAPHTMFNVPIGAARHFAVRSWALERTRLLAKHADATVNDVILAMSAGALRTYLHNLGALPAEPLIAMVPVSLRCNDFPSAPDSTGGNRVGVLMCNLATHLSDHGARLDTIRTCMREGKQALRAMTPAQVLAMSALGAAPLGVEMLAGSRGPLRPPFNLVISNVAGPDTPLYWNGARLDSLSPLSIPVTGQALNITATSSDDQLVFGLTSCRRTVPNLHPMLGHLDTELDALEQAIGL